MLYIYSADQPGEVANPACGQLNREDEYFLVCPRSRLRIWPRETRSAVPSRINLLNLPAKAESGAYSRGSSRFTWGRSICLVMYVCIYGHTHSKSMDQPGMVANPARGQLNRGNMNISLSAFAPENLISRDGFGSPVPRQPAHLHTQAESGAYLRDSSRVSRRRPYIYLKPPYATGPVPSLSGHAIAYRWCSMPRVRRHRAGKPQRSSERVLPWQVTMDQLICASLSHIHPLLL